jgi:hypothetical protein
LRIDGAVVNSPDRGIRWLLVAIALLLGIIVIRPYLYPESIASADAGTFEHVMIVSGAFLYKGSQGVLLLDKRNGNIWFIGRGDQASLTFRDPVLLGRLPLEKLDHAQP